MIFINNAKYIGVFYQTPPDIYLARQFGPSIKFKRGFWLKLHWKLALVIVKDPRFLHGHRLALLYWGLCTDLLGNWSRSCYRGETLTDILNNILVWWLNIFKDLPWWLPYISPLGYFLLLCNIWEDSGSKFWLVTFGISVDTFVLLEENPDRLIPVSPHR